jgi:hypothetical protein
MVRGGMGKMLVGSRVDERKEKYESGSKGMNNNRLVDTKVWCRVVTLIENEILSGQPQGKKGVRQNQDSESESREPMILSPCGVPPYVPKDYFRSSRRI